MTLRRVTLLGALLVLYIRQPGSLLKHLKESDEQPANPRGRLFTQEALDPPAAEVEGRSISSREESPSVVAFSEPPTSWRQVTDVNGRRRWVSTASDGDGRNLPSGCSRPPPLSSGAYRSSSIISYPAKHGCRSFENVSVLLRGRTGVRRAADIAPGSHHRSQNAVPEYSSRLHHLFLLLGARDLRWKANRNIMWCLGRRHTRPE
ncbi:unnamed protein product [Cyclocybe aegerita]|uniref:Secreted protein n=1 Tax=Cyclocybe aegerita TaxID=1973307 RepID=A0A8S0VRI5_CYCAE|nr:unnamed protein product [Cyclocybe aegerita]